VSTPEAPNFSLKPGGLVGRVRAVSDAAKQVPALSGYQVLSAGFAAAMATFVTSRFGVAGTLLGAALTAMIITGGSAILRAYLEAVTGNVRKVPRKLRERRNRWRAGRVAEPDTVPERPDLRDNFAGRMRAALGWFSHLPPLARRSILVKGLLAAAIAFVIGMGAVYAVETGIGNSLSCGIWGKCPAGASPGIHLGASRETGAGSTLSLGRAKTTKAAPGYERQTPDYQPDHQVPPYQQRAPSYERPSPSDSRNAPGGGTVKPDRPAQRQNGAQRENGAQPKPPSSASPAPGQEEQPGSAPAGKDAPSDASPAPSQ
jgi:hypothetical protein